MIPRQALVLHIPGAIPAANLVSGWVASDTRTSTKALGSFRLGPTRARRPESPRLAGRAWIFRIFQKGVEEKGPSTTPRHHLVFFTGPECGGWWFGWSRHPSRRMIIPRKPLHHHPRSLVYKLAQVRVVVVWLVHAHVRISILLTTFW